jgi:phospholipid/cholesterol/gamma-HCH transport system ATP-binding protein
LFDSMTVGDNVAFPLREHTKLKRKEVDALVREKLELVGLHDVEMRFPSELSGGMRKRVGLARAIVLQPSCVLYDEPTTGLDPITTDSVNEMILETKRKLNVTSVVISHDIGSALAIGDDIAVLSDGQIVADGTPAQIRASEHPFVKKFVSTWFAKN